MQPMPTRYPRNEFEDDLWRNASSDEHLRRAHDLEFTARFATREDALGFADRVAAGGHGASLAEYAGEQRYPWQVTVRARMTAAPGAVAALRRSLGKLARLLGGCISREPLAEKRPLTPI